MERAWIKTGEGKCVNIIGGKARRKETTRKTKGGLYPWW
jgi:hypothetical protein